MRQTILINVDNHATHGVRLSVEGNFSVEKISNYLISDKTPIFYIRPMIKIK